MPRVIVFPAQSDIGDPHTLIAQKYAGALIGHAYRADQQKPSTPDHLHIEKAPWKEPKVFADDCAFCARGLSDEQVTQRVLGYQAQIDIEVMRGGKNRHYTEWLSNPANRDLWVETEEVEKWVSTRYLDPDGNERYTQSASGERTTFGTAMSHANRRRFIELFQNMPTLNRPDGWQTKPFPMVDLPLRLKRKLCIEWNHLYRDYLARTGYHYDFEKKEFWKEVPQPDPCEDCNGEAVVSKVGTVTYIHTTGCPAGGVSRLNFLYGPSNTEWYRTANDVERALFAAYFDVGNIED